MSCLMYILTGGYLRRLLDEADIVSFSARINFNLNFPSTQWDTKNANSAILAKFVSAKSARNASLCLCDVFCGEWNAVNVN